MRDKPNYPPGGAVTINPDNQSVSVTAGWGYVDGKLVEWDAFETKITDVSNVPFTDVKP